MPPSRFKPNIPSTAITPGLLICVTSLHLLFALRTSAFFSGDDFAVLAYITSHPVWEMVVQFMTQGDMWGFRKIVGYLVFKFLFSTFHTQSLVFIFTNYLFHTANVLLIYWTIIKLRRSSFAAFFSALIFSRYFLVYFSNVHEYLAVFFSLQAGYLFLRSSRPNLVVVAFILALLSKEISAVFIVALLALALVHPRPRKSTVASLMAIFAVYLIYQLPFYLQRPNQVSSPYHFSVSGMWTQATEYLPLPLLVLIIGLVLPKISWAKLLLAFSIIISLLPPSLLTNRFETYYLYFPGALLALFLGLSLPRLTLATFSVYLAVFLAWGGRSILPPIARQDYPNWQKKSLEEVVARTLTQLKTSPEFATISFSDLSLARDARLMLGSQTIHLFLDPDLASRYEFNYQSSDLTLFARRLSSP